MSPKEKPMNRKDCAKKSGIFKNIIVIVINIVSHMSLRTSFTLRNSIHCFKKKTGLDLLLQGINFGSGGKFHGSTGQDENA